MAMGKTQTKEATITALLRRLTERHIVPETSSDGTIEDPVAARRVEESLVFSLRILGSRIGPHTLTDEISLEESIKKKLMRNKQTNDALGFSDLCRKLERTEALTNVRSVLYLLNNLSNSADDWKPFFKADAMLTNVNKLKIKDASGPSAKLNTDGGDRHVAQPLAHSAVDISSKFEISEAVLLRDVIYVLQGIDGRYITFNAPADRFRIDPSVGISVSVRHLLGRLCELGWLYKRISSFLEKSTKNSSAGLVNQALCNAIQAELNDYYRLVAVLEGQIASNQAQKLTLRRLLVWTYDPLQRLKLLAMLTDSAKDLKGGALASAMHAHHLHGDPFVRDFMDRIMQKLWTPVVAMIKSWIFDGIVEDPFNEFLIACEASTPDERLWRDKYSVRTAMLPSFIDGALAEKILLIGKSINFMRRLCDDTEWKVDPSFVTTLADIEYGNVDALSECINSIALSTNSHVLHLLYDKYKLNQHLDMLKRYLLCGQGDFIQVLMDSLSSELSKPASKLFRHNLAGVMDAAHRASSAVLDNDLVDRLDVLISEPSKEYGWDVFSLNYTVDSPLNTVLSPDIMKTYLRLFNFLWRLKRVDHCLRETWRLHMSASHLLRHDDKQIRGKIHTCHMLRMEMVHFVDNLQYYIMFEVLECLWKELVDDLAKASDLEELIAAHSKYLQNLVDRALLGGSTQLMGQLTEIFDHIIRFHNTQVAMFDSLLESVEAKKQRQEEIQRRQEAGEWGAEGDDEDEILVPPTSVIQLREIVKKYEELLKEFVAQLAPSQNTNVRFLTFRLDFNEFYQKKEKLLRPSTDFPRTDISSLPGTDDNQFENYVESEIRTQGGKVHGKSHQ